MYRLTDVNLPSKPIRYAMIGGARGSFFAPYHRTSAQLAGGWELVAGAFSSDEEKGNAFAAELGLDTIRAYPDVTALIRGEQDRDDGAEVAVVVTPNHLHATACRDLLTNGYHVICDKPLANDLAEAKELEAIATAKQRLLGVTYTYLAFPMVREARARIERGDLGEIRMVYAEYLQEWLGQDSRAQGAKHAAWRLDPARAGKTGTLGDVGTHAFALLEYLAGRPAAAVSATMDTMMPDRPLDDHDIVVLDFEKGARGLIWATQVAPGHRNGLRVKIVGSKASLEWRQEEPEKLWFGELGGMDRILYRGQSQMTEQAKSTVTLPAGNPEGYLEALGILYDDYAKIVRGETVEDHAGVPQGREGRRGLEFIEACLRSSAGKSSWTEL